MALSRQSSTGLSVFLTLALVLFAVTELPAQATLPSVISDVQPKMVKIYGAGGIRGLESYQSGFLISEEGHILTAWSYVLDTDYVTAVLDDGRKFKAETVGADPRSGIAVLKIDVQGVPHFSLQDASSKARQRLAAGSSPRLRRREIFRCDCSPEQAWGRPPQAETPASTSCHRSAGRQSLAPSATGSRRPNASRHPHTPREHWPEPDPPFSVSQQ